MVLGDDGDVQNIKFSTAKHDSSSDDDDDDGMAPVLRAVVDLRLQCDRDLLIPRILTSSSSTSSRSRLLPLWSWYSFLTDRDEGRNDMVIVFAVYFAIAGLRYVYLYGFVMPCLFVCLTLRST